MWPSAHPIIVGGHVVPSTLIPGWQWLWVKREKETQRIPGVGGHCSVCEFDFLIARLMEAAWFLRAVWFLFLAEAVTSQIPGPQC